MQREPTVLRPAGLQHMKEVRFEAETAMTDKPLLSKMLKK